VLEPGSDDVRDLMARSEAWFTCRVAFVETARAVGIVAGSSAVRRFSSEWPALGIVEVDQALLESATALSVQRRLQSLDALHLAAALLLPRDELVVATWDQRLHEAAVAEGLSVVPALA
jgi:predicted nucleic acid-binding protein